MKRISIVKKLYSSLVTKFEAGLNNRAYVPDFNQSGKEFFDHYYYDLYSHFIGPVFSTWIMKFISIQSRNSINFGNELVKALLPINGSVIDADIHSLYSEVLDNPREYGLDNIVLPQCSLDGVSQVLFACFSKSRIYVNSMHKNYMWSDTIHPSPFMHKMIANYMESIVNAPIKVSSISRQLNNLQKSSQNYLIQEIFLSEARSDRSFSTLLSIGGITSKIGGPYSYRTRFDVNPKWAY